MPVGQYHKWRGLPDITANLVTDVDASSFGSLTIVSGNVSAWGDKSPAANNWAQSTAGQRPAYNASDATLNGRPSVAVAAGKLVLGTYTVAQPDTVYVIGWSATSSGADLFDGNSVRQAIGQDATGYYFYAGSTVVHFSPSKKDANMHIFAAVFNGASSELYIDSSASPTSGNPGVGSLGNPSVAGGFPDTSGGVGRVRIYSTNHTAQQVSTVFQYLAQFYGTTWF